jgi:hypothetical protein
MVMILIADKAVSLKLSALFRGDFDWVVNDAFGAGKQLPLRSSRDAFESWGRVRKLGVLFYTRRRD